MKPSILILFLLLLSCNKKMSSDEPLPKQDVPTIIVSTQTGKLWAINALTGNKIWSTGTQGSIQTNPCIIDSQLFIGDENGFFYGINRYSGKINWQVHKTAPILSDPCTEGSNIYFGTPDSLYSLHTNGTTNWQVEDATLIRSNPTISKADNYIYFPSNYGDLFVTDIYNPSPRAYLGNSVGISTNPYIKPNGQLFHSSNKSGTYTGQTIQYGTTYPNWTYLSNNNPSCGNSSSPCVYGGMVFIGDNCNNINCIDEFSGLLRWAYPTADNVVSSPIVDTEYDNVIVGSNDFNVYAINFVTGALRWKYPTASFVQSSPCIYDKFIYFTSYDKYLYCLYKKTGTLAWKYYLGNTTNCSPVIFYKNQTYYSTISGNSEY